ncbi:MAG: three-Cys-motif partner protein TcmP [Candidatus Cloacimonetes bacterium]|nr:three-Cys-motif partner protein TcmP [Candidatus Cloacimonadota bacterium]
MTLDLRSCTNADCMNCKKPQREEFTESGICKLTTSVLDNLPVRCVGSWATEKIYRLTQYFGIFAKGMSKAWVGLNYIEICSGPGRCTIRETGEEIDGTPLAILNSQYFQFINKAVFIDNSVSAIDTLNMRITKLGKSHSRAVYGDYRDIMSLERALSGMNTTLLTLAFIDPTDCSVPFETIKYLKRKFSRIDVIFNFAYGTDMIRNIRRAIENPQYPVRKKYDLFFGNKEFLSHPDTIKIKDSSPENKNLANAFLKEYKKNLDNIGLKFSAEKYVKNYYWLLFASGHKTGLKFWNESQKIGPDDQREFHFED